MVNQIDKLEIDELKRKKQKEFKSIADKQKYQEEHDRKILQNKFKKFFHSRNIQIAKLINTTDRIQTNHKDMSSKLHKMLDRVELDRPLLFKEKMDTLWNDQN